MFDARKLLDAMTVAQQAPAAGTPGQGGLGDLLGNVMGRLGVQPAQAAGVANTIGTVLGQATEGLKGAARDTGVGPAAADAFNRVSGGKTPADLLAQAQDFLGKNKLAGGAALGGLAALFLGTKAGRGLAVDTAKLGGLALVGGLAYKAWQNYQQGKPLIDTGASAGPGNAGVPQIAAAPDESPFGSTGDAQHDNATATLLIRAMIAAASADGVVDPQERKAIVGNLERLGVGPEAASFLAAEFATPATPAALAAAVARPEDAAQVYTAARLAIDPDHPAEKAFLTELAGRLGLDAGLVAHIDAAAESAKVARAA